MAESLRQLPAACPAQEVVAVVECLSGETGLAAVSWKLHESG